MEGRKSSYSTDSKEDALIAFIWVDLLAARFFSLQMLDFALGT